MKMEQTEYSKTLAFKLQTPVNHPEESIQNYTSKCNIVPPHSMKAQWESEGTAAQYQGE
jgi:hypothetical protein